MAMSALFRAWPFWKKKKPTRIQHLPLSTPLGYYQHNLIPNIAQVLNEDESIDDWEYIEAVDTIENSVDILQADAPGKERLEEDEPWDTTGIIFDEESLMFLFGCKSHCLPLQNFDEQEQLMGESAADAIEPLFISDSLMHASREELSPPLNVDIHIAYEDVVAPCVSTYDDENPADSSDSASSIIELGKFRDCLYYITRDGMVKSELYSSRTPSLISGDEEDKDSIGNFPNGHETRLDENQLANLSDSACGTIDVCRFRGDCLFYLTSNGMVRSQLSYGTASHISCEEENGVIIENFSRLDENLENFSNTASGTNEMCQFCDCLHCLTSDGIVRSQLSYCGQSHISHDEENEDFTENLIENFFNEHEIGSSSLRNSTIYAEDETENEDEDNTEDEDDDTDEIFHPNQFSILAGIEFDEFEIDELSQHALSSSCGTDEDEVIVLPDSIGNLQDNAMPITTRQREDAYMQLKHEVVSLLKAYPKPIPFSILPQMYTETLGRDLGQDMLDFDYVVFLQDLIQTNNIISFNQTLSHLMPFWRMI